MPRWCAPAPCWCATSALRCIRLERPDALALRKGARIALLAAGPPRKGGVALRNAAGAVSCLAFPPRKVAGPRPIGGSPFRRRDPAETARPLWSRRRVPPDKWSGRGRAGRDAWARRGPTSGREGGVAVAVED